MREGFEIETGSIDRGKKYYIWVMSKRIKFELYQEIDKERGTLKVQI